MERSRIKNTSENDTKSSRVMNNVQHLDAFERILNLPDEQLKNVMAHRKDCAAEMQLAFKELNVHTRSNLYADFIEKAGRNIYPVIIALENDKESEGCNGNTFVLYLEDGSEYRVTPGLNAGYAVFKSASHVLLGIGAILGPFMKNPKSHEWKKPLQQYKQQYIQRAVTSLETYKENEDSEFQAKPVELLLKGVISFINQCLTKNSVALEDWEKFNNSQLDNVKRCFTLANEIQSKANLEALLKWKIMLGPEVWRELYVVVPTTWPVSRANLRAELFRALLDKDKVDSNIILSEYPRCEEECRTLLGRIVGDRAIARYGMDVTNDDFLPALNNRSK